MEKIPGTPLQLQHRRQLVDALRSGKYEQAQNVLRDGKGAMCCLGVACEISGLGHWDAEDAGTYLIPYTDPATSTPAVMILNGSLHNEGRPGVSSAMDYFGLKGTGDFTEDGKEAVKYNSSDGRFLSAFALTTLNDAAHFTFLQIADVIEERWEVAE